VAQALEVQRCGVLDAGGAVLCEALSQTIWLTRLDVSWNALGPATAHALEAALRANLSLEWLDVSHNALDDKAGALVLDSLAEHGGVQDVGLRSRACMPGFRRTGPLVWTAWWRTVGCGM